MTRVGAHTAWSSPVPSCPLRLLPHTYREPSLVTAATEPAPPADICFTSRRTSTGSFTQSTPSPAPHDPRALLPQVYTMPDSVSAAKDRPDEATCTTRSVVAACAAAGAAGTRPAASTSESSAHRKPLCSGFAAPSDSARADAFRVFPMSVPPWNRSARRAREGPGDGARDRKSGVPAARNRRGNALR